MKKIFLIYIIFCGFSLYGQKTKGTNPPPPQKHPKEIANYNVDDNIVFFKIDKLSNSFNFAVFDSDISPSENIFIISFIVEENYSVSNLKIEKGKNEKVINELKRLIYSSKFPPSFIDSKATSKRPYTLNFIFDYKNKTLKTTLYEQETKGVATSSPPSKNSTENPLDNKIYYIVDKKIEFNTNNLSNSFDFENLDENKPNENIFIVSFIAEKTNKITDIKIESGKDDKTITELKRLLSRLKFHPALIKNKLVRSFCKLKFVFDYKNQSLKIIIL